MQRRGFLLGGLPSPGAGLLSQNQRTLTDPSDLLQTRLRFGVSKNVQALNDPRKCQKISVCGLGEERPRTEEPPNSCRQEQLYANRHANANRNRRDMGGWATTAQRATTGSAQAPRQCPRQGRLRRPAWRPLRRCGRWAPCRRAGRTPWAARKQHGKAEAV